GGPPSWWAARPQMVRQRRAASSVAARTFLLATASPVRNGWNEPSSLRTGERSLGRDDLDGGVCSREGLHGVECLVSPWSS
ncbi:hypothetical protein, partial [Streptomyces sp. NPDC054834]